MGLILASASPRRQELLRWIVNDFKVCPADVDENLPLEIPAQEGARYLAEKKAKYVASQYADEIVIGSDTTVLLGDTIYGKPGNVQTAKKMLRELSGKMHEVITGVAIVRGDKMISFETSTKVHLYSLTEQQIQAYVETGEPLDKAGAYGIQGRGALLIEKIEGDFYGVIGLPIAPLARALREFQMQGGMANE